MLLIACERVGNAIICGPRPRYTKRSHSLQKQQSAAALELLKPIVKLEVGCEYVVSKFWTGTFRGRLTEVSWDGSILRFHVTDTMRPGPLIEEKCPYPECMAEDGHDGDHIFSEFRNGAELEVRYSHVELRGPLQP